MASYETYDPQGLIARAMFNFDATLGRDFRVVGPVAVSVSGAFTATDARALPGLSDNVLTSLPAPVWTAQAIANVESLLQIYENFVPVQFSAVANRTGQTPTQVGASSDIDIALINRTDLSFSGFSATGDDTLFGYSNSRGDIVVNVAKTESAPSFSPLFYSGHVLMHEIGHTLGLAHPHDHYVGTSAILTSDFAMTAFAGFDRLGFVIRSGQDMNKEYFSIMSYEDQVPAGGNTFAQTPMILDVIALQEAYGEGRGSSGAGDDTLTPGADGAVTSFRVYFDMGGRDTIDLTNYASGAYLHMGAPIESGAHPVGVSMSRADEGLMRQGSSPESLRWFYGDFENARGSAGDDYIVGNALDNTIEGRGGNDIIDGSAGFDRALFSGPRAGYRVAASTDSVLVEDLTPGRNGRDFLTNVEMAVFTDGSLVFAPSPSARDVYLLYRAAFGRTPDTAGFLAWTATAEAGFSAADLAGAFAKSPEFIVLASMGATSYVGRLYAFAFGREADPEGLNYWAQALGRGLSGAELLADFAFSAEAVGANSSWLANGYWTV